MVPYAGELCALSAAVLWALAIVLFKRSGERVHPIALNTFKNVLAGVLYVPTIYALGGTLVEPFGAADYWRLVASGAIGLALGDTLTFQSLNMIGASASALVGTLYSPFMIGLSALFLGERLSALQSAGVLMIVGAVFETTRAGERHTVDARRRVLGVVIGAAGLLSMAIGIVMIKPLLNRAPLLWAVEIRLAGGVGGLLLYLAFHPARRRILSTLFSRGRRRYTVSSSFLGAYLSMLLWLAGMKLTLVSVASALNQTNMVFILIFAALILHEKITPVRAVAIAVAFAGAILVTFG